MLKILIIEDDGNLRDFLENYFTGRVTGYTVFTAPDKATALRLMQSQEPDLLLLDLGIPPEEGAEPD
jgi:two-component system KDP operon response regulator KdpE